ncbi:hypothetical protein Q1695_002455 [Nippostrongylus brasiliensis]|nr:hypothetical protein Q1695_002455 [Nippostrongylus brasiliensis]
MTDSVYMEGWLIRSRDRGMHFPPFKSKWVRRYFVLRVCDKRLGAYVLDEFRKEDKRRLRKSLDLVRCVQIDSHLQLADSSCATTSRFGGFQWIFSLYLTKGTSSNKKHPLYFVSESEEKMKDWVYSLCRACRLEKETDEDTRSFKPNVEAPSHRSTLPSSLGGLSVYSGQSSESMLDTPRSEVSREFEVMTAWSTCEEDELHTFEFVHNPKRVSRFNSRLCTTLPQAEYGVGSQSNPVTPSDPVLLLNTIRAKPDNSTSNPSLRTEESSFWRDSLQRCPILRHSFSHNISDIIGLRQFKLHLKREMNAIPTVQPIPDVEVSLDNSKSKRPHPHSRSFRNQSVQRHASSSSAARKSSQQRRTRRTDSLEGPRASSSASACSSITSDHRSDEGDDDSTSCISQLSNLSCGPPVPPRTRLGPQYSSASSSTGVPVKRYPIDHLSSPPARYTIDEAVDNESSGETIKMHGIVSYANSQCSSDSRMRSASAFLPPAVDRSNKPAKLRLYDLEDEKVPEEMTIHGYNKSGNSFTRTPRTPQSRTMPKYRDIREPPKSAGPLGRSRELDYFNPVPLDRTHSLRSPAPSDIEYIKIDAEKTQAVKQSIAQRATIE